MASQIDRQNKEILALLSDYLEGLSRGQVSEKISFSIADKTLQRRLSGLVEGGLVRRAGQRKGTRNYPVLEIKDPTTAYLKDISGAVFSETCSLV